MALPTAYTEQTLKLFMLNSLGAIAQAMSLTIDSFSEAVNEALLVYGASAIAEATDIAKLRAIARVEALKVAKAASVTAYDFDADGGSYKRSQMAQSIDRLLQAAQVDAGRYSAEYSIQTGSMSYTNDPYQWTTVEETDDN